MTKLDYFEQVEYDNKNKQITMCKQVRWNNSYSRLITSLLNSSVIPLILLS